MNDAVSLLPMLVGVVCDQAIDRRQPRARMVFLSACLVGYCLVENGLAFTGLLASSVGAGVAALAAGAKLASLRERIGRR